MFSGIRSFLSRHRRKFLVTGIIVGGAYFASRYLRNVLREYHDKEMKEMLLRTCKQQHYDSVERAGNQTIISLATTIHKTISELMDTEAIVRKLKNKKGNKVESFNELKLLAFGKLVLLIYISSIIAVTLRLQINIVGGYLFKGRKEDKFKISDRVREMYLNLCQEFLNSGVHQLKELIQEKVELVMSGRSLKEKLKLQDFEQILWAIHSAISDDARNPVKHLGGYLLTHNDDGNLSEADLKMYQTILLETRDLFESEEVIAISGSCIKQGFSFFVDNISEFFLERSSAVNGGADKFFAANINAESNVKFVSIPIAKVLPLVNAMTRSSGSQKDVSFTWIQQLILMNDLKVLGANVYECFSD